jgi:hypothetical protein
MAQKGCFSDDDEDDMWVGNITNGWRSAPVSVNHGDEDAMQKEQLFHPSSHPLQELGLHINTSVGEYSEDEQFSSFFIRQLVGRTPACVKTRCL